MGNSNNYLPTLVLTIICLPPVLAVPAASPGDLDPTFSGDGKVIDGYYYGSDSIHQVAIQQDGKLVAVGDASGQLGLSRYNSDGSLDTSFGHDGKVRTPIQASSGSTAISVAIQSDGKVVAADTFSGNAFVLLRYNPDGSQDTGFGVGGITRSYAGYSYSLNLQSDGKIVVAGGNSVRRFNSNGSPDTSFGGGDGLIALSIFAYASVIQSDGKIVVGGRVGAYTDFAIVRCNPDGSFDTTFDGDGGGDNDDR